MRLHRYIVLLVLLLGGCTSLRSLIPASATPAERLAASVTIVRDEWGVPHIFGDSDASVAFGAAYAQAEDSYFQIEDAYLHFEGRVRMAFGWGTNLTNDFEGCAPEPNPGLDPISIVIKVSEANGRSAVKLSDNPAKATGEPAEIARYLKVFGEEGRVEHAVKV